MSKDEAFLALAYAGLVLRGYDSERQIKDPILREVWRRGKRLAKRLGEKKR
jgi:hypothetical protein